MSPTPGELVSDLTLIYKGSSSLIQVSRHLRCIPTEQLRNGRNRRRPNHGVVSLQSYAADNHWSPAVFPITDSPIRAIAPSLLSTSPTFQPSHGFPVNHCALPRCPGRASLAAASSSKPESSAMAGQNEKKQKNDKHQIPSNQERNNLSPLLAGHPVRGIKGKDVIFLIQGL
ncbi:hypothetical protein M0R45_015339 [Rubus argutus]|uniref:Uncharacterized protein n=1 Tax=Rubus argutus TaxID=59490 RepID=A0AAW1XNZ9_RUBAR